MDRPFLRPARYGTSEVALILGTDDWRIRNFASDVYGFEPTVKATGRGTRRYYGFEALLRLAVADELYSVGFGPDAIKGAVQAIDDQKAIQKWSGSYDDRGKTKPLSLILGNGKNRNGKWERVWRVVPSGEAKGANAKILGRGSVAVSLDLVELWEWTVRRITELEGEGQL